MKKIILQRDLKANVKVTFGKILLDWIPDHPDIYSIELKKHEGEHGFCITQGFYNCKPHNSINHPNTYELLLVPNRTDILIHSGNFASDVKLQNGNHSSDTLGCILIGFGIEEEIPMIIRSKEAMDYLRKVLGKDNFCIEIKE